MAARSKTRDCCALHLTCRQRRLCWCRTNRRLSHKQQQQQQQVQYADFKSLQLALRPWDEVRTQVPQALILQAGQFALQVFPALHTREEPQAAGRLSKLSRLNATRWGPACSRTTALPSQLHTLPAAAWCHHWRAGVS